ncbi:hypothetical protein HZA97_09170 [Candidatus Woesearchaeota archaeon]|nr:hypothetical protein [Candidatus Woesearchaeota archaeon]
MTKIKFENKKVLEAIAKIEAEGAVVTPGVTPVGETTVIKYAIEDKKELAYSRV